MYIRRHQLFFLFYLFVCALQLVEGYFGLAARKHILIANLGLHTSMADGTDDAYTAGKLCDMMLLQRKQRKMCRRDRGVADTLIEATNLSILECEHQFKRERWNCSLGDQFRLNILKKGFKETSFLYAISSASLVHTFARACSRGTIERCTCDESKNVQQNREAWLWGGCGDNIKFGLKFSRRFLRAGKRRGKDIRARVDQHNIRLGRKVVKTEVTRRCKCHGISGSCTVSTCWRQLSTFPSIGKVLKEKYENSYAEEQHTNVAAGKSPLVDDIMIDNENAMTSRHPGNANISRRKIRKALRRRESKRQEEEDGLLPKSDMMVHLENSPTFCEPSRYSPGTKGRVCDTNCEVMCCGRGYNIRSVTVTKACQCQVHWCCYVECKQCVSEEEFHLCK